MLEYLDGVQVHLDDVLVAEQRGTRNRQPEAGAAAIPQNGVKFRESKCQFRKLDVTYLDHRSDRQGLYPIEKNLEAIRDTPTRRNVSELRSFLRLSHITTGCFPICPPS